MRFAAVLFDLGYTLLDYGPPGRWSDFRTQRMEQLHPLAVELWGEIELSAQEFGQRVGSALQTDEMRALEHGGLSLPFAERMRAALAGIGLAPGQEQLGRFMEAFHQPIRDWPRPYPDTEQSLAELRSLGLSLAIITNAPWDAPGPMLSADLERWGLRGFFAAFIGSGEVPWRKPNPEFMWAAAKALAVPPPRCLVVGDNPSADIAGARAAGMCCVWMNRDGQVFPPEAPRPDWVAQSLRQVVEVVRSAG